MKHTMVSFYCLGCADVVYVQHHYGEIITWPKVSKYSVISFQLFVQVGFGGHYTPYLVEQSGRFTQRFFRNLAQSYNTISHEK